MDAQERSGTSVAASQPLERVVHVHLAGLPLQTFWLARSRGLLTMCQCESLEVFEERVWSSVQTTFDYASTMAEREEVRARTGKRNHLRLDSIQHQGLPNAFFDIKATREIMEAFKGRWRLKMVSSPGLTAFVKMSENSHNLTSTGPEDHLQQLEAPTSQGTHPQMMSSQMGYRVGTVGATTHFRTRAYSGSHPRNVYERPAPRDFRPEWMIRAAALPNAAPAPRLRESILEGGSTFWNEEGAPNLVEQWIRDSNFDTRSEAAVVCDDAKSNDTVELDSTIDLTDEGVGSFSHSGATDENEKSNKSNSAMEKSDQNENRKNVNQPSDKNGIDNAAEESANDGNPVASSERKADVNNDANLLDDDLGSSNTAWPAHDDAKDAKSGNDCHLDEDDESIKTSSTPWPIYEDDEKFRTSSNPWSIDENRVVTISNTLWPIEEDARSNSSWSDEVGSSNTPWMTAEEEIDDVGAPDVDTSFSSYSTALSHNITTEGEDDGYRYCFYLNDMTSGKYGDQKLTFNQWLEIKTRERAQPDSDYNLENIPVRDAEASASSNSTLPTVMGDMLRKH